MQRTKQQIETSIARLTARYARLCDWLDALHREQFAINEKRAAIAKSIARLEKTLTTPREDRWKRVVVETTVAEKKSRRIRVAPFDHPDGTKDYPWWWFRCGKQVLARYVVGDPIDIPFRYKKPIGGKGKWDYP